MIEKCLWISGSLPFIILGAIHLFCTFFSNKFSSRNQSVNEEMKTSFPVLTNKTTIWKLWVGFNASHSLGAIYIGVINIFLVAQNSCALNSSLFVLFHTITVLLYLWVSKRFWFSIPFLGMAIAACCFVIAITFLLLK
jgi:hypothetical protein